MEITDKQWKLFQEWQSKANRESKNRPYRGRSQRDPDSVIGYHSKAIRPTHPTGERHHLVGLARMNPVYQTIKTKEQLGQFVSALRESGVALGDSWEQMIELPRELHDSSNPEAIHRVEAELGLDDPLRYVPENATFEDALAAIPKIQSDQQESRRRVQDLQYRSQTVGDAIGGSFQGFTDAVLSADAFPEAKSNRAVNNRHLKRQLASGKQLVPRPLHKSDIPGIPVIQKRNFINRLMAGNMKPVDVVDAVTNVPGVAQAKTLVQAANPDLDIEEDFNRSIKEISNVGKSISNEVKYMTNRLMQGNMPYGIPTLGGS